MKWASSLNPVFSFLRERNPGAGVQACVSPDLSLILALDHRQAR